jgi:hypothetical protein
MWCRDRGVNNISYVSIQLATHFHANIQKSAEKQYAHFPTKNVFLSNCLFAIKAVGDDVVHIKKYFCSSIPMYRITKEKVQMVVHRIFNSTDGFVTNWVTVYSDVPTLVLARVN